MLKKLLLVALALIGLSFSALVEARGGPGDNPHPGGGHQPIPNGPGSNPHPSDGGHGYPH